MKYLDLDPVTKRRCEAMWLDSETTIADWQKRFKMGHKQKKIIEAILGKKAALPNLSHCASSQVKRLARRATVTP